MAEKGANFRLVRVSRQLFVWVGAFFVGALGVLLTLELVFWGLWSLAVSLHPDPLRPESSPAYAGAVWVPDLYREQSLRLASPYVYAPFTITGITPWHGKYFNNDEHTTGVWRRTDNTDDSRCKDRTRFEVWIFGGSTVYGTGVPDSATLPSFLSRELNSQLRECVEVENFGNESYVTTQELILLSQQLKRGSKPDIVVFYDGFNDAHIGMRAADPAGTHYGLETIKERVEGSLRGRIDFVHRSYTVRFIGAVRQFFGRKSISESESDWPARASSVVNLYEANHNMANALGQSYHFKFYGFWQPMLFFGHKHLVPFEAQIARVDSANNRRLDPRPIIAAYQEAATRSSNTFAFLGDVFDSVSDPIYIDEAHLGPHGNELVARAIAKYIESHPGGMVFNDSKPQ
jgi:lysophospholipase L1-like esterase